MGQNTRETERIEVLCEIDTRRDEIVAELERVLASEVFQACQQHAQDFLRRVVLLKLDGETDRIKEVTIAVEVYGEPLDFNPAESTKIRVAASDLRTRLGQYYATEGRHDAIRIDLPVGTYEPEFILRHPDVAVLPMESWSLGDTQEAIRRLITDELVRDLKATRAIRPYAVRDNLPGGAPPHYQIRAVVVDIGDTLTVAMLLHDTRRKETIFFDHFTEKRADVFEIVRRLAAAVTETLAAHSQEWPMLATLSEGPESFQARSLYQTSRAHLERRTMADLRRALEGFETVIKQDPSNALAYSGLADCMLLLSWYELGTPDRLWFKIAKDYAETSVRLQPALVEGHTSLAFARLLSDLDWTGSEEAFKTAIKIDSRYAPVHHWYGELLVMRGRFDEAKKELKRAFALDRGSSVIRKSLGDPHYYSRDYAQAAKYYRDSLKIHPDFWMAHLFLGWSLQQLNQPELALLEFDQVEAQAGKSSILWGARGHLFATTGQKAKAKLVLQELLSCGDSPLVAPHALAVIYAGLGENDEAFEWLDISFERRIELLGWVKVDPRFDNLRKDPRFENFLARMGLSDAPTERVCLTGG